ncbi:MAG: SDR family oxidoreductase [Chloroflexi bacterium]|nr:SDR family oxidoreductase [Chloroflexota bacterium]
MDLELRGRTAVVGGATSGLGRASANALAAEGCRLLIWSRDEDRLSTTAQEIRAAHRVDVAFVAADATSPEAAATVASAASAFGKIDVVVTNAGGPPTVDPTATDPAAWQRSLQLLASTPIELVTRLLPGMRERGWGRVISILSSGIRQPIGDLVYSNAGRSVLASWLKTTARTIAAEGVTLNGVLPGRIATPRIHELDSGRAERQKSTEDVVRAAHIATIPAGRYGRPEELAALIAFLASERASYLTGQLIAVDGGLIAGM